MENLQELLPNIVVFGMFIMSIVAHEVAHGWIAFRRGDPTAMMLGRLTFNPIKHIDPWYTIIMPLITWYTIGIFFGGAKPVPINPYKLGHMDRDMMLTALAGPLTNIMIALFFTVPLMILAHVGTASPVAIFIFIKITIINLALATFNMVPIPPLDGSRVLRYFMPPAIRSGMDQMERYGLFMVLIVIVVFGDQLNALLKFVIGNYLKFVLPHA